MHFQMEVDVDDLTRASMSTKKLDVESQISPALLVFCGGLRNWLFPNLRTLHPVACPADLFFVPPRMGAQWVS